LAQVFDPLIKPVQLMMPSVPLMVPIQSTMTRSDGSFEFANLAPGKYPIWVTKTGCTFSPSNTVVTIGPDATVKFTPSCSFTLSGTVNQPGVTIAAGTSTTTSGVGGTFSMILPAGDYTVTPSMAGCGFTPTSVNVRLGPSDARLGFAADCPRLSSFVTIGAAVCNDTDAYFHIGTTVPPSPSLSYAGFSIEPRNGESLIDVHMVAQSKDFVRDVVAPLVFEIGGKKIDDLLTGLDAVSTFTSFFANDATSTARTRPFKAGWKNPNVWGNAWQDYIVHVRRPKSATSWRQDLVTSEYAVGNNGSRKSAPVFMTPCR
jgi:hypothetical protein